MRSIARATFALWTILSMSAAVSVVYLAIGQSRWRTWSHDAPVSIPRSVAFRLSTSYSRQSCSNNWRPGSGVRRMSFS